MARSATRSSTLADWSPLPGRRSRSPLVILRLRLRQRLSKNTEKTPHATL